MVVGDKVVVTKEICGHGFRIGQQVEIREVNKSDYTCTDGVSWYLLISEEFELLNQEQ